LRPGGRLVINAIRKEDTDKAEMACIDFKKHLWYEKTVKTVANVTSNDVREFLEAAAEARIKPEIEVYALPDANRALMELHGGSIRGSKVLEIGKKP
ncbi:unnamed protein product, partial [marine sediment metagenome]